MIWTCSKFRVLQISFNLSPRSERSIAAVLVPVVYALVKKVSDVIILNETGKEHWYFDGLMTAFEADGSYFRGKFRELRTECQTLHTEEPTVLVDVERVVKHSITLKKKRESD